MTKLSASERQRYWRHIILDEIGEAGQLRLSQARVLVVGAGGLGCPLIQYLTSTGVGTLSIADDDVVEMSNLQRQVFYGVSDLGKHKSIIAAAKMRETNPHVTIKQLVSRVGYDNIRQLAAQHDVVVDCTDNLQARYVLNDGCILENRPLVHASVHQTQGMLSVFNYDGGPSYRCLFSTPPPLTKAAEIIGIYSVIPGILGLLQANEVLKILLGKGDILSGRLLFFDAFRPEPRIIRIQRNPDNFVTENIINHFQTPTQR